MAADAGPIARYRNGEDRCSTGRADDLEHLVETLCLFEGNSHEQQTTNRCPCPIRRAGRYVATTSTASAS